MKYNSKFNYPSAIVNRYRPPFFYHLALGHQIT